MPETDPDKISELEARLESLVRTQIDFQVEITAIRKELTRLRNLSPGYYTRGSAAVPLPSQPQQPPVRPPVRDTVPQPPETPPQPAITNRLSDQPREIPPPNFGAQYRERPRAASSASSAASNAADKVSGYFSTYTESARSDLEKFIGENLISKIGIVVLVLGVGIGVKYAIDNGWITPLMRVVLGYLMGLGLIGLAAKLKPKYHSFSAVLFSGGVAILYFITYFAYAVYALVGQPPAFAVMVFCTIFTVAAALFYDRQIIAHYGLVGGYAVPFLLSNNSGQYAFLFTYMAILNAGILAISVKKAWKPVFYTASIFTWLIFGGWFANRYSAEAHFYLALIFAVVFFAIFYAVNVVHGVVHAETDNTENIATTVVTALIYYGFCLAIGDVKIGVTDYAIFFTVIALSALAILLVSYRFYGRIMTYVAFPASWLIFGAWFVGKYSAELHFYLALIFAVVFFVIFYVVNVIHGIVQVHTNEAERIATMAVTAVIFYGFLLAIGNLKASVIDYGIFFGVVGLSALAILLTSYRFYGRILSLVAFPATWIIFGAWFFNWYSAGQHFVLASAVAAFLFLTFYGATLVYRLVTDDIGMSENTSMLMTNSFVFYGFGYGILDSRENLQQYEGLFTAAHGVFHSLVAQVVGRVKSNASDVIQTLAVLIITFATIAIPVQFDGKVITLVWSVESAALFAFGRLRRVSIFEYLSYPVMTLATCNLFIDWINAYGDRTFRTGDPVRTPLANGDFITGLMFVAGFAFICIVNKKKSAESVLDTQLIRPFGYLVAALCVFALYNVLRMEIGNYFYLVAMQHEPPLSLSWVNLGPGLQADDLGRFNAIAQINFTMLFLTVMAAVNIGRVRSSIAGLANSALGIFLLAVTATVGMSLLYELRVSYLSGETVQLFGNDFTNVAARFVTYAFSAAMIVALYQYCRDSVLDDLSTRKFRTLVFEAVFYPIVLIFTSCELMNIAAHLQIKDADKFGLSILWGVFALAVIVIGIAWAKKHLRIGAFVILAVTLAKLFFYDISELGTIPKTLLFVSLGMLMLLISFLYNKYKHVIFGADTTAD